MSLTTEWGGIDVMAIVSLCHEIQDAAKRRETKSGGTIMCAQIASKILRLLEARAPSQPVVAITDEMVERSLFAYWNKTPHALAFNYIDRESMRAALTAALTPPPSKDGG